MPALLTVLQAVNDAAMEIGIAQRPANQAMGSSDEDISQMASLLTAVADELLLEEPYQDLLGDGNWWVRLAARESLAMMGSEVWPLLMRRLSHEDRFIRNGAAEVLQNLGVLDSLIVMEAASDSPAPTKIALLRRIVDAGGVQFTESLVERSGPVLGPRIRQLVASVGLEHIGAH